MTRPSPDNHLPWGAILVGGAGKRMGADKALIELNGRSLISIVHQALLDAGITQCIAIGGNSEAYRLKIPGLLTAPDDFPGQGPLGGIITALSNAPSDVTEMVILACDLVGVCETSVRAVIDALELNPDADVAVAVTEDHLEPLHGVWRRSALGSIERSFQSGTRAVHSVLEDLNIVRVNGLKPEWLRNVNTPQDLLS